MRLICCAITPLRNWQLRIFPPALFGLYERVEMNKKQELKYLKKWGFKNRVEFERAVKERIEDLEFIAPEIFGIFEKKIKDWERNFLKNRKKRFVAKAVSPSQNQLVKSPDRIAEKIFQSWEEYDKWYDIPRDRRGKEPKKHHPKKLLNTMNDLIRFRIVCNYLSDVHYIEEKLRNFSNKAKELRLVKCDDYIETPYPERRAGHRALQFIFQHISGKEPILFEVQVMTQLQHAWDKKDHHLIYEYVRIKRGEEIPVHLRNRMAAMSELLYVADNVFDSLQNEITNIMGEK